MAQPWQWRPDAAQDPQGLQRRSRAGVVAGTAADLECLVEQLLGLLGAAEADRARAQLVERPALGDAVVEIPRAGEDDGEDEAPCGPALARRQAALRGTPEPDRLGRVAVEECALDQRQ